MHTNDRVRHKDNREGKVVGTLIPIYPHLPILVYVIWDGQQCPLAHPIDELTLL